MAIILITFSCKERSYYENGNIKKVCIKEVFSDTIICKEYFKNGNIKLFKKYYNNELNSHVIKYYKNGIKHEVFSYRNGMAHGVYKEYYKNGVIKKEGYFDKGKASGDFYYYDKRGRLNEIREYVILEDESYLNQIKYFDIEGYIIGGSEFYEVLHNSDTICLDSLYFFNIVLHTSFADSIRFIFGNYSENYTSLKGIPDTLRFQKYSKNSNFFELQRDGIIVSTKFGNNTYRGIIQAFDTDSINNKVLMRQIYFKTNFHTPR